MGIVDISHRSGMARLFAGRQQERITMKENGHNSNGRGELGSVTVKRGLAPVSYTHLDVYKRQNL